MSALNDLYNTAKATEDTVFAVSPVPLSFIKSGIQSVGVPLVVSAVASQTPFVAPIAGAAIKMGSDAFQSGTHSLAFEAMSNLGESIASGLPTGAGIQTAFNAISSQTGQTLLAGQDLVTHAVGAVGSSILLGRTIANSATLTFQKIRPMTVNEVIASSQRTIQRLQDFVVNAAKHVRQLGIQAELFVKQEFAKMNDPQNKQEQNGQSQVPEAVLNEQKTQMEVPDTLTDSQGQPQVSETVLNDQPIQKQTPPGLDNQPVQPQESPDLVQKVKAQRTNTDPTLQPDKPEKTDRVASDYFQALASELGGRNLNTEKMKIFFNDQEIFRLQDGQPDPNITIAKMAHMKAFQEALSDPQNFKGSLEIRQGNKLLLSIKDGQVYDPMKKVAELLNVKVTAPSQSIPETTTQGFYKRYSQGVQTNGLQGAAEIAKNAINAGHSQNEVLSMLLENNPTIRQFSSQHGETVAKERALQAIDGASRQIIMDNHSQPTQVQEQQQAHSVSHNL